MLNPNAHPDDERLAALAGDETDARADASLSSHVDGCTRCSDIVAELGTLRASLAELPDLAPSRPLRLVPPAEAPASGPADGGVAWVRRLFAPLLTAGAALALVGVVGTTMPGTMGGSDSATLDDAAAELQAVASPTGEGAAAGAGEDDRTLVATTAPYDGGDTRTAREAPTTEEMRDTGLPAERSPWPMVLFSGVAIVIGALLLRWILVPRAA
jgi:hypothetical protein